VTLSSAAAFLASWPFLTGDSIVALAFLVPAFLAARGIRARKPTALLLASLCHVAALWNGAQWLRYTFELSRGAEALPGNGGLAASLAPVITVIGCSSLGFAIAGMILGWLVRNEFRSL
jgi:hypothetical protein